MQENKNLILAFVVSLVILLAFDLLYMRPMREAAQSTQSEETVQPADIQGDAERPRLETDGSIPQAPDAMQELTRDAALAQSPRVTISSSRVTGSVALRGGRIDDLTLLSYRQEVDEDSPPVVLLSPAGVDGAYFADFGWAVAAGSALTMPGPNTLWQADGTVLTPDRPLTLRWESPEGAIFMRTIALDDRYMFTVTQRIENRGEATASLAPYALISRHGTPKTDGMFILHEGAISVMGETLAEHSYSDLRDDGRVLGQATGGWLGFTDKYWLMALIPDQGGEFEGRFSHRTVNAQDRYQADFRLGTRNLGPGESVEVTSRLFAGAKVVSILRQYEQDYGIARFEYGVDWGWFHWITRPIFYVLHWLHGIIGNFGLAILALTVMIKIIFYPLANKSYVAMSKMKKLQPKMKQLQERYKDDKPRLQQELMEMYKKEKVNPVSGCLPILIQIPVFFALYKVLYVTIEMRHAPFFGWVDDLSAPDPLTFVNLFGLIPWDPPQMIAIGIWPILMGITMFLQMKLNPAPADPIQAKIMMFMPILFTVILAPFPVGLVIYWTWNNILSILQQWVIMKRMGVPTTD